jgi:hypothetical protein
VTQHPGFPGIVHGRSTVSNSQQNDTMAHLTLTTCFGARLHWGAVRRYAANFYGHVYLTTLLLQRLMQSEPSRWVAGGLQALEAAEEPTTGWTAWSAKFLATPTAAASMLYLLLQWRGR